MTQKHFFRASFVRSLAFAALALAGCSSDDGNDTGAFELEGMWTGDFGDEVITAEEWATELGAVAVVSFDNAENTAITQSPPDDEFSPDKFAKVVWTEPEGGTFYYCLAAFGLDTEALAEAAADTTDASDPESGGCSDFPWTKLTRVEP